MGGGGVGGEVIFLTALPIFVTSIWKVDIYILSVVK